MDIHGYIPPEARREYGVPNLSVQERVLALAMLNGNKHTTTSYREDDQNQRITNGLENQDWDTLVKTFSANTKDTLAIARYNLYGIMTDEELAKRRSRNSRLGRYLDAYASLQIKLDRSAYPPNDKEVKRGVPEYVMDGLSDMGQDEDTDPHNRRREKIRVNKQQIFDLGQRPHARNIFQPS